MKILQNKSGFSLVEILLSISIFSIFTIGITYLSLDTLSRDAKVALNNEALLYAQEGLEATRNIRDKSFLEITNGDHGLNLSNGTWSFDLAPENIENFYQRTITVSDVYRNDEGSIDSNGNVFDPDTKKIESEVSWIQNGIIPRSITLTQYMSNWRADDWLITTCTEFSDGTFENTEVVNLPAPPIDNCGVALTGIEVGSSFFSYSDVGKHGSDVDLDGNYVYLATNDANKGLNIIDVSDKQNPSVVGYENIGGKGRYVKKDGNYAYLGVEKSSSGLAIINVTDPANPTPTSTVNIGDYGNQSDIIGNYLFQAIDQETNSLKIYDITSKNSPSLSKTVNLGDGIRVIKIRGNYAYVGMYDDFTGFKILDITNPINPQLIGSLNVGEEVKAIELKGNIAYLAIESTTNSLKVVDITNPASPSLVTAVDIGGAIQDLVASGDYLYAAVDKVGSGLAAINIENTYNPYYVYSLDINGKGTGIDADGDYVYTSTDTANRGLVIVGETVTGSAANGTYTSTFLDTNSNETLYNYIEWEKFAPPGSSIKFQIRTSNTEVGLAAATWVGSDGTNATYYENSRTPIILSPNSAGTRYLQYKAYISSDGLSTPILDSVKINYTP